MAPTTEIIPKITSETGPFYPISLGPKAPADPPPRAINTYFYGSILNKTVQITTVGVTSESGEFLHITFRTNNGAISNNGKHAFPRTCSFMLKCVFLAG